METSILIEGFGKSTSTLSAAEDSNRRNQQGSCSVVLLVVFWMISSPHIIINYHNLPHINDITTYSPHICQQPFFGVRSGNAGGTRFLWVTRDSCSLGSFPC